MLPRPPNGGGRQGFRRGRRASTGAVEHIEGQGERGIKKPSVERTGVLPTDAWDEGLSLFAAMDVNGDGSLSSDEVGAFLSRLGVPKDRIGEIFEMIDCNHDGVISRFEFVRSYEGFRSEIMSARALRDQRRREAEERSTRLYGRTDRFIAAASPVLASSSSAAGEAPAEGQRRAKASSSEKPPPPPPPPSQNRASARARRGSLAGVAGERQHKSSPGQRVLARARAEMDADENHLPSSLAAESRSTPKKAHLPKTLKIGGPGRNQIVSMREMKQLRGLFKTMDADGGGTIDWDEFQSHMSGEHESFAPFVRDIFSVLDVDQGAEISFRTVLAALYPIANTEELDLMTKMANHQAPLSERIKREAEAAFRKFDKDGNEQLDLDEWLVGIRGFVQDEDEGRRMFRRIDTDFGGTIDIEEFQSWWLQMEDISRA